VRGSRWGTHWKKVKKKNSSKCSTKMKRGKKHTSRLIHLIILQKVGAELGRHARAEVNTVGTKGIATNTNIVGRLILLPAVGRKRKSEE